VVVLVVVVGPAVVVLVVVGAAVVVLVVVDVDVDVVDVVVEVVVVGRFSQSIQSAYTSYITLVYCGGLGIP